MPTGTSTIFGVFQAILAPCQTGRSPPSQVNLVQNQKFASEIFFSQPQRFYAAVQKEFTYLCGLVSKQCGINRFSMTGIRPDAGGRFDAAR
jgi:hypothetical protein